MRLESSAADIFPPRYPSGESRNKSGFTGGILLHRGVDFSSFNTDSFAPILFGGLIFGCIGSGAWMYGKRRSSAPHMILGAILIGYAYFTDNLLVLYGLGTILTAMLFVFKG